jgi:hypothetical protein
MSEEGMPTVSQNKSKCVCDSPFLVEMPVPSQGHYDFHGCWLIVSVYILMSFDFPFVRFLWVRGFWFIPLLIYMYMYAKLCMCVGYTLTGKQR